MSKQWPNTYFDWMKFEHSHEELVSIAEDGMETYYPYYDDPEDVYNHYHAEIWNELWETKDQFCPFDSILEFVASITGAENVQAHNEFTHLITCYVGETYACRLVDEMERENE